MEKITLHTPHSQILKWFQLEFKALWKSMEDCTHHFDEDHINPYHVEGKISSHTMLVFKLSQVFSPDRLHVKWSTLLHDCGKPAACEILEDRQKVRFIGHEGISAFMAIDILNKTDMLVEDKLYIFKLIALHGSLFHHIKKDGMIKDDIRDVFQGSASLLEDLTHQVRCDSFGRWVDLDKVDDHDPLFTQMLPDHFAETIAGIGDGMYRGDKPHQLTILVGPPCSRKSTWLETNTNGATIISRDTLVEAVGMKYGQTSYSDSWKWLKMKANEKIEKEEVDAELVRRVQEARRSKQDVIVDMTNMSKKARRKWLNQFEKDYNKRAVVFLSGYEAQLECNRRREIKENKRISKWVTLNMLKGFSLPMYGEGFDTIDYIWND